MGIEIEIYSLIFVVSVIYFFVGQKSMDVGSMLLFYMRLSIIIIIQWFALNEVTDEDQEFFLLFLFSHD